MKERNGGEIIRHLRALVKDPAIRNIWSVALPLAVRIVNSTYSDTLGCSPNALVMYRPADVDTGFPDQSTPHRALGPVSSNFLREIFDAHERMLDITSERLALRQAQRTPTPGDPTPAVFTTGQYVLLRYPSRAPSKLHSRLAGPFIFTAQLGRLCTINGLTDHAETHEVDIERLVPFVHQGSADDAATIAGYDLGENQVSRILLHLPREPQR